MQNNVFELGPSSGEPRSNMYIQPQGPIANVMQ
jgi:hypothetical protein